MTCYGHPMQRQGQQLVCGRYGAWIDPGTQASSR